MNKNIKILCTLSPKNLTKSLINKLDKRNVSCFRINLSHTTIPQLEEQIQFIQKNSNTRICIDTEGAQVRNCTMSSKVFYKVGQKVKIVDNANIIGDEKILSIRPKEALKQLKEGSIVTVDFDGAMFIIDKIEKKYASASVINSGYVVDNRAITFFPFANLSPLTTKDKKAIKVAKKYGINTFALSFTNSGEDAQYLRKLAGKDSFIISKIETKKGVENISSILSNIDAILIDRGDLSREVPFENIPFLQKMIIKKSNSINKPAYVATNLLESMITNRKPTRAEINDTINTLLDGATGLVLAAETAIGDNPIECVDILRTIIKSYNQSLNGYRVRDLLNSSSLLLPNFHGTNSTSFKSPYTYMTKNDLSKLDVLNIDLETTMDALQILYGAYSPLNGFMNENELNSVLHEYSLPDNTPWTLPILLQVKDNIKKYKPGDMIVLKNEASSKIVSLFQINDCVKININKVSKLFFGTNDNKHPGVKKFKSKGSFILGGKLSLIQGFDDYFRLNTLYPNMTRMIFSQKGWSNIIGFHTRNIPHKGHEQLIINSLKKTNADGIFIHPIVGPKKKGDFNSDVTLQAYDVLINDKLDNALVSGFFTYPRYAGPREAIFTAICRKNYGCKYFIIGRDHTGVGSYYKNNDSKKIMEKIFNLDMEILFFDEIVYLIKSQKYVKFNKKYSSKDVKHLKGTDVRDYIINDKEIPKWLLSKAIIKFIKKHKIKDLFQ